MVEVGCRSGTIVAGPASHENSLALAEGLKLEHYQLIRLCRNEYSRQKIYRLEIPKDQPAPSVGRWRKHRYS